LHCAEYRKPTIFGEIKGWVFENPLEQQDDRNDLWTTHSTLYWRTGTVGLVVGMIMTEEQWSNDRWRYISVKIKIVIIGSDEKATMTNSKYQRDDKQILIATALYRTGRNEITLR